MIALSVVVPLCVLFVIPKGLTGFHTYIQYLILMKTVSGNSGKR